MAKSNLYGYNNSDTDCTTNGICHIPIDVCTDIQNIEEETSLNVNQGYQAQTQCSSTGFTPYKLTCGEGHTNDDLDLEQIPVFRTVNLSKGMFVSYCHDIRLTRYSA